MRNRAASAMGGLTEDEVLASREKYGANTLTAQKGKGFFRHFFGNMGDPIIRILLCALGVNLLLVFRGGDWVETVGIAVSVFLATLISTLSERGSEAAFRRLSEECDRASVRVRRNGRLCQIPMEEVVVGDRVLIGAGEQIPADGFVIEGTLRVDQAAMKEKIARWKKARGGITRWIPMPKTRFFVAVSFSAAKQSLRSPRWETVPFSVRSRRSFKWRRGKVL